MLVLFIIVSVSWIQNPIDPWTKDQLIKPEVLVQNLLDGDNTNNPVIINIGPSGSIKGAIEVGSVDNSKKLKLFKDKIKAYPKDTYIVVYCGCCPFEHCPNIRPSFNLLNQKGFKNHKLLDLPENLKVDWIDKGYPMD